MHITLAIPTFNRADSLAETLNSVARLETPSNTSIEVLVVDNSSTDHTFEVAHKAALLSPVLLRYVVEKQPGLCFGRNRALRDARGEHIVFLDDDIQISHFWLFGYLTALEAFAADCVIGPVFPVFPEPLPSYATKFVLSLIGSDYSRKGNKAFLVPRDLAHEVPGCNFGVRKEAALAIGGFNNALDRVGSGLLAGGDTEFGMRLAKTGRRVVYEPECAIRHLIPAEKLDPRYLRRRVDGLGLTSARLRELHGPQRELSDWLNGAKLAVGLWVRWQKKRAFGAASDTLEWELRARRHWRDLTASVAARASAPMTPATQ